LPLLLPILRRVFSPTPKAQIPAQGCYRFLLPMLQRSFPGAVWIGDFAGQSYAEGVRKFQPRVAASATLG
jgi:hypothetical protein